MLFGLKNAAQTFQRLMDTVCRGLDFVFVYLDDILVASTNYKQHSNDLQELFGRLKQHGLMINEKKCQFGVTEIDILGYHITSQEAIPKTEKVEAFQNLSQPTTIKGLQEFAGMVNFYHRFIPSAAKLMQPLYQAIAGKSKILTWSEDMIRAFSETKKALANATMLVHPRFNAPIALTVDAFDIAVGAVLQQKI